MGAGVSQGAAVLRRGLPVGTERCRPSGRAEGELPHGRLVARVLGERGQPGELVGRDVGPAHGRERPAAQLETPDVGHRGQHGLAGQLVPERDGETGCHEHAALHRRLDGEAVPVAQHRVQHLGRRGGAEHGHHVDDPPGLRRQPGHPPQHGVPDRCWRPGRPRRQQLGDEERVAAGHPVQLVGVGPVRRCRCGRRRERADGVRAEPVEAFAMGRRGVREVPEHDGERVRRPDLVVAVGRDERRRGRGDPPAQVAQQVEGPAVGPVHVLEDDDGRPAAAVQLVEQRREHGIGRRRPVRRSLHRSRNGRAEPRCDVDERAQRPGRRQRVAGSDQHPGVRPDPLGEAAHDGGLADAGLAVEQDEPALPCGGPFHV